VLLLVGVITFDEPDSRFPATDASDDNYSEAELEELGIKK